MMNSEEIIGAFIANFHFLRPMFLLGIIITAGLLWWMNHKQNNHCELNEICDDHLIKAILDDQSEAGKWQNSLARSLIIFMILSLLSIGLAGPSWQKSPRPLFEPQNARVVILGLAPSMSETDIAPSRLIRAKFKAIDLIKSSPEFLQALVVYSGDAFTVSPLSDDRNTIINLIKAINMHTLPTRGNRAEKGLEIAAQLLDLPTLNYREIVLISDSASQIALQQTKTLQNDNIHVSILAIHSTTAMPAPLLDEIADAGNGAFVSLSADSSDIAAINEHSRNLILAMINRQKQIAAQFTSSEFEDFGIWLLVIVLIISAFLFRKGWLLSLLLSPLLFMPEPIYAFEWQDILSRQDQQAARAFSRGEFATAINKNAYAWQAAAAYRSENYIAAARFYALTHSPDAYFNRGTSLAKAGKYKAALSAYDNILETNPTYPKAMFNRKIVKELLEKKLERDKQEQAAQLNRASQGNEQQSESEIQEVDSDNSQNSEDGQLEYDENEDAEQQGEQGDEEEQTELTESSAESTESEEENTKNAPNLETKSEEQQELEQWLRMLPDDPADLLKRKFRAQYQQRQQNAAQ